MRDQDEGRRAVAPSISGSRDLRLPNHTGHPCAVVPYDFAGEEHQQPVCAMIVGALFADDAILSVAHAYQNATDWHLRRPQI
jgi:aspartyl-tRNA(Asn)/glutamyl-tRNA(Gln) amidotransferase subunit A